MGTGGSFLGRKAARAWRWPLTAILYREQECAELYLHSPQYVFMEWCLVKHRDNFTSYLLISEWYVWYRSDVYDMTRQSGKAVIILKHIPNSSFLCFELSSKILSFLTESVKGKGKVPVLN
jgi:hypothetical protein